MITEDQKKRLKARIEQRAHDKRYGVKSPSMEMHVLDDNGDRVDADLHAEILGSGDHDAAAEVGRAVMLRAGLTEDQINLLLNPKAD
jgi:hypothetical protein